MTEHANGCTTRDLRLALAAEKKRADLLFDEVCVLRLYLKANGIEAPTVQSAAHRATKPAAEPERIEQLRSVIE